MASCFTHPEREAAAEACHGCGRPFCEGCLVRFEKLSLCESCKARYLDGVDDRPSGGRPAPDRAAIAAGAAPPGRDRPHAPRSAALLWVGGGAALLFSAAFVFVIVASLAQPFQDWTKDRRFALAFERLVTVGAALERFRADSGKYPEALGELVPSYLHEVPDDPYARGKSPRWGKGRLWSVGPDGKDDGGERPDDLVYEVTLGPAE